ncbi:MAG TPA: phosphatase PAP2 family protein [Ignavibacteriaceae bacterium]
MNASERDERLNRRYKRYTAYSIIILSLYIFFLCANGFIAGLTEGYNSFLLDWLGKTNKWSGSYGSEYLVDRLTDLSSLAGPLFILIFSAVFGGYLLIKKRYRTLNTYILVVFGAGIFHIILKNVFSGEGWSNWHSILSLYGKDFPSGHAFMSVVFYFTLARLAYRANRDRRLNRYFMTIVFILSFSIGIAQVIRGAHSPNDIIAGWAVGFAWITSAWLLDHFIRKKIYIRRHQENTETVKI